MGYTLKIGEAKIFWDYERVNIDVPLVNLASAPAFGEQTDYENQRWPSYAGWADFVRNLEIEDVMFNARNGGYGFIDVEGGTIYPLIDEHPGAMPITQHHLRIVEEKLAAYQAKHPTHRAEFPPLKPGIEKEGFHPDSHYVDDPTYDPTLCRAEWLVFWMRFAVQNCENPVFWNS